MKDANIITPIQLLRKAQQNYASAYWRKLKQQFKLLVNTPHRFKSQLASVGHKIFCSEKLTFNDFKRSNATFYIFNMWDL